MLGSASPLTYRFPLGVGLGLLALVALGVTARAPNVAADTVHCRRVNGVPAVISAPGTYCVGRHLVTAIAAGAAIAIESDHVTLDLGGFTLEGTAGLTGAAIGIHAVGRQNITVRDGTVQGFERGIMLDGGANHLVERIRAAANQAIGIFVSGPNSTARRNQVLDTPGRLAAGQPPAGLGVGGDGSRVIDNDVYGFPGTAGPPFRLVGVGIGVVGNGAVIEGNRVGNPPGAGPAIGIAVDESENVLAADNRVTGIDGTGILFSSIPTLSTGKCRDNLFHGVTTNLFGCTDAGNNN